MDRKSWLSPEMVIGLCALVVSLVAVIVGVYSAYTDRTYARASVWPRVELNFHLSTNEQSSEFGVKMSNSGIGPAIIKTVLMEVGGKYLKTWKDVLAFIGEFPQDIHLSTSNMANIVLPAEQTTTTFHIKASDKSMSNKVMDTLRTVNISVCYCSVYDECWLKVRKSEPKKVEQCVVNSDNDFKN